MTSSTRLFNKPEAVALSINKLKSLEALHGNSVRVPSYSNSAVDLDRSGIILARTVLGGSGGDGIAVVRPSTEEVPEAPLYTQYIPKLHEYRAHVLFGQVRIVQQKRRRSGEAQAADARLIRNHGNGWVFTLENVDPPEDVLTQSINAVKALGLDFGAVDVIVGRDDSLAYVLEVNTAPGLTSPTVLEAYKEAILEEMSNDGG